MASPATTAAGRERRPFLWLSPRSIPRRLADDVIACLPALEVRVGEDLPIVVRSLVDFTIARQNRRHRRTGAPLGVSLSVLNRRRRAARAWVLAILAGQVDRGSLHGVTHSFVPQLAGTGPDVPSSVPAGIEFLEFLRGVMTSLIFSEPEPTAIGQAKALHALDSILGVQLRALHEVAAVGSPSR